MKMTVSLLVAALIAFMAAGTSQAQNDRVKAMWVWDFYTSASTPEQRNELIQFSLENRINQLFIRTNTTISDHGADYAELIQNAHQNGIRVFALAGEASWALKDNHQHALEHIRQVLDYHAAHPSFKFDGIQFDIEPYTLPGFSESSDRIGLQFLELLQASGDLIAQQGDVLEYNAAIPFWYATGKPPIMVEFNGESKPLSHHVLDIVDSVSIMAYRDNAKAQIEVSKADIEYAAEIGKKAYVGTETMPPNGDDIPDWITYHTKKTKYMNEQLEAIKQYFTDHPGFAGIAVHSYESFKDMRHKEAEYYRALDRKFSVLKDAGIMKGYADGSAGYGKSATRAEAAVIAAKLGGYSETKLFRPATASFNDVPHGAWYYGWVESAHKSGVMSGKNGETFDPKSNITVQEILIVMAQALGLSKIEGADVQGASDWAQGWIQAMIDNGLAEERNDYTTEANREDLVAFVYDSYKYTAVLNQ